VLHLATITAPFFPALAELGEFERVEAAEMPAEYQTLLAHEHHMTVTVEAFHGEEVGVKVLAQHRDGEVYSRASLLVCRNTGRTVQLGIMSINLHGLSDEIRSEILSGRTPLGRTLIRHNVLRRVELQRLWRICPGPVLTRHLELPVDESLLGSHSGLGETGPHVDEPLRGSNVGGLQAAIPVAQRPRVTVKPSHINNNYIYGRSAGIFVEGRRAVELLEIVTT
jgi:chorismate-pyruvate lyase